MRLFFTISGFLITSLLLREQERVANEVLQQQAKCARVHRTDGNTEDAMCFEYAAEATRLLMAALNLKEKK